jgi:hypothetical protein
VLQDSRRTLAVPLALASVVGLLACPQLLPDDFDPVPSGADPSCTALGTCASGSGGAALGAAPGTGGTVSGAGGSASGSAGAAPGTGGSAPGTGGSSSNAGSGGQPDTSGGAGGAAGGDTTADAGPEPTPDPGCRALYLSDSTHSADDNCVGVNGWNAVVTDETTTPEQTVVTLSYQDGQACFEGTIEPVGWGAVFNLTFANEQAWDATDFDVEGFRLDFTGPSLPPSFQVIYTEDSDFCQLITPPASASLLFADSHPNCTGSAGSTAPDPGALRYLRLPFPVRTTAYDVDFCLRLVAIP